MKSVSDDALVQTVERFLRGDSELAMPRRRERSWDLAYNYFQASPHPTEQLEMSSLQLGYYLASWGMLRGSSFLFRETNALHYADAIEVIERHNTQLRGVDVPDYRDPEVVEAMWAAWSDLRTALLPTGKRATTLVSKVMMGAWGCLPSYDTFFIRTFQSLASDKPEKKAFQTATTASLALLADFYDEHADTIEDLRRGNPTTTFSGGQGVPMTAAKVIDIYGFGSSR